MNEHDENLCGCVVNAECACPCVKCWEYRKRDQQLRRMDKIRERLEKAEIDVEDLADLIWMTIELRVEKQVEALARQALADVLRDMQITSFVTGYRRDL